MRSSLCVVALLAVACGSEEFETKAASNEDAGGGNGGTGATGGTGGSGGGTIGDSGWVDSPVTSCDLDAGALDTEGCACSLEDDTKGCYLGKPGPQSACTAGSQMCKSGKWGPCTGAVAPGEETCGDDVDNDCDGEVDEKCICSATYDLCKQNGQMFPAEDNVFVDKPVVSIGDTFHVYAVTTSPLPSVALNISSGNSDHCAGQAGSAPCDVGAGCNGWNGRVIEVPVTSPPFSAGTATLTVFFDDPDPPCDASRKKTLQIQVQ